MMRLKSIKAAIIFFVVFSVKNRKKLAFCLFILYICRWKNNRSWPKDMVLQRPLQDIATLAARSCHARCKILPRPPQA